MYVKEDSSEVKRLSYLQIAWCYCLAKSLRKEDSIDELRKWISAINFEQIEAQKNVPLGILSIQTRNIRQLYLNSELDRFSQIRIEETLERLTTSMGKCERIKSTVFPPMYKYGLHATIYLFVIFLALSVSFRLQHIVLEMVILVIVSMVFFFLEKAAFRMQDPFENIPTDTPMTSISHKIKENILDILGEKNSVTEVEPRKFYVL
jgi:putative membrane protein